MKKIITLIFLAFALVGCSFTDMDNTPSKKVEKYLNSYQILDSDVLTSIDTIVNNETLYTESQKNDYKEIIKKHYQNLVYNIKEETVNGDTATVEVEIEVTDYSKVLKEAQNNKNSSDFIVNNTFDNSKYIDYKLNLLKNSKDKVKYTLYLTLQKVDKNWTLNSLTKTDEEKILGIYEY